MGISVQIPRRSLNHVPANIEIKARACDWDAQFQKAEALAQSREELAQEDVFFNSPQGRLKLRILGDGKAYLVFYKRPDVIGPKVSEYEITPVADSPTMLKVLSSAMGELCRVRKRRTVFHYGSTRIHFDEVEGLGRFIELECVLSENQDPVDGVAIVDQFMKQLNIRQEDLIDKPYAELERATIGLKTLFKT